MSTNLTRMNERILEERKKLGFNQTDFAKIGGVQISAQSNYEKGTRIPNADYLAGIESVGADIFYIVTGKRSSHHLSSEEVFLLEKFRTADKNKQVAIWSLLLTNTEDMLKAVAGEVGKGKGSQIGGNQIGDISHSTVGDIKQGDD